VAFSGKTPIDLAKEFQGEESLVANLIETNLPKIPHQSVDPVDILANLDSTY